MNVLALQAKSCMAHLLLRETFDSFSLIEADITTFNTFHIDGYLQKDFFSEGELPDHNFSRWKDVREFCLNIIKGKRTPLNFKIVLSLGEEHFSEFLTESGITSLTPQDIQGLYLNFHYDGSNLQCVTGTSTKVFTLDKSLEQQWDLKASALLKNSGIELLES